MSYFDKTTGLYACGRCGKKSEIVNGCGCDPANRPTCADAATHNKLDSETQLRRLDFRASGCWSPRKPNAQGHGSVIRKETP